MSRKKNETDSGNKWPKRSGKKQTPDARSGNKWPKKSDKKRDADEQSGNKSAAKKSRGNSAWDKTSERPSRQKRKAGGKSPWATVSKKDQQTWTGIVSAHPDGFGFVDVVGVEKGFFLPHEQMNGLMHGDTVEVRAVRNRGRESAEVVRIVEHASSILVGQFLIQGNNALVKPRSRKILQNILIAHKDCNGATDGDWVRIDISRGSGPLRGRVQEVLGDNLSPSRLIDLIVAELGLTNEFPAKVVAEANAFSDEVAEKDIEERKDLRHLPFVTIDGEDARDFDDAICVLPRGEGFETWVAIADVAHYVKPRSALDEEALERSNSFYFPDRVIPMLPEKLSNGLCSLNPNVARLAMTVRMRFDANGTRRSIHIYNAVIHSQARLTYTQVAKWLEDGDESSVEEAGIRDMLDDAARLFRKLLIRRERRGALDLDMPEVRAKLENDVVVDMTASDRNIAHRLIEEMMLSANTAVAEYMESHHCPTLYRVHAAPEREAIEKLNDYLAPFGLFVVLPKAKDKDGKVKPGAVQHVLSKSAGKPFAHVLHRMVLRSMQRAQYTPNNEGHFGLAYESYAHFTSPIRRYADLIVHRRLKALIKGQDPNKVQHENTLAEIGSQTSTQERKQQRGEWDTQAMLAALFHAKDVGKTMSARISGLTKRRIFFELEGTMAEASLDVDDLTGAFILDEMGHTLASKHSGHAYHLGETLDVVIESTDPVRGQILARLTDDD
ncbi:ribonuclease R [Mariprofundus sp. EBB-1]|uniref:ribonuclease R n=1 Tax=Mariprofundus sp. EBB-1 TaxID=2650971 RepID=UPI000EF18069|nr:ribonuclease R [Mariprofundus sp. EBB-1]RLL52183.1 ribonuclease R [Mariprofundus sp. EBB-1]